MRPLPPMPGASRQTELARMELSLLPGDLPLSDTFARTCELAARALGVERVGVWLFVEDGSVLRSASLFERSKGEHASGAFLRVQDFPTYFASLRIRKAVPAEVAATDPWTSELADAYLAPLGISSMLDAGIFVEGELRGVLCHEHVGPPREWTTEERDFAGSVADLLAVRIQGAQVRELRDEFRTHRVQVAERQKQRALEQLAAGVVQDFKGLLQTMVAQGRAIRSRVDAPDEVRMHGQAVIATAERGIALAEEILEFAEPGPRPPSVLDLADVTQDLLPLLRTKAGRAHPIHWTRPGPLGQVLVAKGEYARVLMNLVANARESMPEGGPIEVRLAPVQVTEPSHRGRYVLLEVTDHGPGIDEATQRRLFEPYFTTKGKGIGLGLAVVQRIVDRVGGFVSVKSEPGKGTTFRLFFPRIGARSGGTMVMEGPFGEERSSLT